MSPADRFIVLTGMSGSGKSQAMRALEDLGYFCVDNLPLTLLPTFAELTLRPDTELEKAAVVIDIREGALLSRFPRVFAKLRKMKGLKPRLIFLEASDAALARRFSETRRPHPLAPHRSAMEGVQGRAHAARADLRKLADEIIDTSHMNVHELREQFMAHSIGTHRDRGPVVTFLSFGFKNGLPLDADLVFDVRFLPNPHYIAKLREKTGLRQADRPISESVRGHARVPRPGRRSVEVPDSALRARRQELPDGRDRLHGRTASIRRPGRSAGARAARAWRACGCASSTGMSPMTDTMENVAAPEGTAPTTTPLIGVVVVTHGQLATELLNAAEMIVGDLPQFAAVSIGWHDDVETAKEAIAAAITHVVRPAGVIVLTDMFGGTPSNLGMTFFERDRVEVITGVNLPMLIKLAGLRQSSNLLEVARQIREDGRNAIWVASDLMRKD